MVRKNIWLVTILSLGVALTGCASAKNKILPVYDEVLVYDLPYDLTYLRTIEALENVDGWEIEETEKEKGILVARNLNFSNLADADLRQATILIKRLNRNQTTISLANYSQHVRDGDKLLQRISQYVSREL